MTDLLVFTARSVCLFMLTAGLMIILICRRTRVNSNIHGRLAVNGGGGSLPLRLGCILVVVY